MSIFLTVEELASALASGGVTKATIYGWTQQRGPDSIPRVRLGRRYGFDLADVIGWLKETRDPRQALPARPRRVLTMARRRAPDKASEGQGRRNAGRTRRSTTSPMPVALEVPSDG